VVKHHAIHKIHSLLEESGDAIIILDYLGKESLDVRQAAGFGQIEARAPFDNVRSVATRQTAKPKN